MKAVVVEEPNKILVKEVPEPVIGDYDVLCSIEAAAVCSGTDTNIVNNDPYHKVTYPLILGHESMGRVITCGSKVRNYKIGDLITRIVNKLPTDSPYTLMWGAFAERGIAVDWEAMKEDGLSEEKWKPFTINRVLPESFTALDSIMITVWRETFSYLDQMKLTKQDQVVLIGTGGNALSFADHFNNMNIPFVVIGSESRKDSFLKKNALSFVSYRNEDIRNEIEKVFSGTSLILDTIGDENMIDKVFPLLSQNRKIGVYGLNDFLSNKYAKASSEYTYFSGEEYDEGSAHNAVVKFIEEGRLNSWDYIDKEHIYPLKDAALAIDACKNRETFKSVILPQK